MSCYFSFPSCKTGIITVPSRRLLGGPKRVTEHRPIQTQWALGTCCPQHGNLVHSLGRWDFAESLL